MKNPTKRYTITAALPYANGPLHIGHIAGAYLPADIYARFLRLKKKEVLFVCGSDEYGAAILMKAKKEGTTPQAIIDKYHNLMKATFEEFGIAFDIYHRTSESIHTETAQDFFRKIYENGLFEEIESEQYFDTEAQEFLADRFIVGTCPKCGNESAYGDQCEKCGTALSPTDLINPKSTISGSTPVLKKTKHWYLPMQKSESWLKEWILEHKKDEWKPSVLGQCRSWLEQGLQSRAMTRDLTWGVPVPLEQAQGKVLYVWLDAPIGYISATKAWAEQKNKNWEDFWKKTDTKLVHFIGKDNIVFHCIIFPIILKSYGGFILPDNVPANSFLNLEGDKISTSRNWAVWLHEYLKDFPNKQDVLRYVLCAILPENKDSEFTWKDFQARNNNELVAILGNFVNRTMVLIHKFFEGKVPQLHEIYDLDKETLQEMQNTPKQIEHFLENYRFREAALELMNLARLGNKYLAETEPWKTAKNDTERTATILHIAAQITANLAVLMQPLLPHTAQKLGAMLNIENLDWTLAGTSFLKTGHFLEKPQLLFEKIEDDAITAQIQKLKDQQQKPNPIPTAAKSETSFDDFSKIDIRIATVLEAKKVPKTSKLLELLLDTGLDKRTVVSGIAEFYAPEQIIGKQVCLLLNLAPRSLKGITSEGMILTAENPDGTLCLITPEKLVSNGAVIR